MQSKVSEQMKYISSKSLHSWHFPVLDMVTRATRNVWANQNIPVCSTLMGQSSRITPDIGITSCLKEVLYCIPRGNTDYSSAANTANQSTKKEQNRRWQQNVQALIEELYNVIGCFYNRTCAGEQMNSQNTSS